jgi:hypothetical protein
MICIPQRFILALRCRLPCTTKWRWKAITVTLLRNFCVLQSSLSKTFHISIELMWNLYLHSFLISFINNRPLYFSRLRVFDAHFCQKFRYKTRLQTNGNSQEIVYVPLVSLLECCSKSLNQSFPYSDSSRSMKYILLLSQNKSILVLHTCMCRTPLSTGNHELFSYCYSYFSEHSFNFLCYALQITTIIDTLVRTSNKRQPRQKIMTSKLQCEIWSF